MLTHGLKLSLGLCIVYQYNNNYNACISLNLSYYINIMRVLVLIQVTHANMRVAAVNY